MVNDGFNVMEPTYPTYDPGVLYPLENGWYMDGVPNNASGVPVSFLNDYNLQVEATALPATAPGTFAPETAGPSLWSTIGDTLSNVIRTVGQQAPGLITGQPTAPLMTTAAPRPTLPFGLSPMMLLLLGGGVLLFFTMRKRGGGVRRNPRRRRVVARRRRRRSPLPRHMYVVRNRQGRFVRRPGLHW